eukprot:7579145-Alexandrium_andersonii.AAC.1
MEGDAWQVAGGGVGLNLRNLKADLFHFYEAQEVPLSLRLGDLTIGMLGDSGNRTIKSKAAETAQLLPFA